MIFGKFSRQTRCCRILLSEANSPLHNFVVSATADNLVEGVLGANLRISFTSATIKESRRLTIIELRFVSVVHDEEQMLDQFAQLIDEHIRIASISHACRRIGQRLPVMG